ncbi:hypothetical protein BDZ94DRAFT_1263678 [Collybia nuda]|uniref:Uncharacterized protein n=1 Tax=Collybia nuda TaxID=64659 RepID=A0A9P6CD73_9AGAR|nr:hypothetical protein BDZ94DRAFT_1263678 [Collybia nuda]
MWLGWNGRELSYSHLSPTPIRACETRTWRVFPEITRTLLYSTIPGLSFSEFQKRSVT